MEEGTHSNISAGENSIPPGDEEVEGQSIKQEITEDPSEISTGGGMSISFFIVQTLSGIM